MRTGGGRPGGAGGISRPFFGAGCLALALPKTLSDDQHEPTITATKKHLRRHPSSLYLPAKSTVLTGVSDMVHDVTDAEDEQDTRISVSGTVAAVMRFQGIVITDRNDLGACCDRIFQKATDLLNRGGTTDGGAEAAAADQQDLETE